MFNRLLQKFKSNKKPENFYQILGEEKGIQEIVDRFYEIMETDETASDCLKAHELIDNRIPKDVKIKLVMFLSGWLGGPNLFQQKYGHPRMRARHMHVKIGRKEKEQWLYCMEKALNSVSIKIKRKHKKSFLSSATALATRIQNI